MCKVTLQKFAEKFKMLQITQYLTVNIIILFCFVSSQYEVFLQIVFTCWCHNIIDYLIFTKPGLYSALLIEISTQNFQVIFLGVKEHHSWRQEWPCHQCLQSGTLNVLQVPPFLTPPSWHTSNWDIHTKFSGYLPGGKKTSFMTSGMILSSMSPVRNPKCPRSIPLLDPPFLTHF